MWIYHGLEKERREREDFEWVGNEAAINSPTSGISAAVIINNHLKWLKEEEKSRKEKGNGIRWKNWTGGLREIEEEE